MKMPSDLAPGKTYSLECWLNREGDTKMTKSKRGRYTLEFKQEAVRLVASGQTMAAAARSLGVVEQTLAIGSSCIELER